MAKFMQSRRKMLIAAGEAVAVGALGYFGLKHFLSSDKEGKSGPKLKVVFLIATDGLGVDPVPDWQGSGYPGGLWHPEVNGVVDAQNFTLRQASNELARYKSQSLYLTRLILGIGNVGHNGARMLLRDSKPGYDQPRHSSIDTILGDAMRASTRVLYATPHNDGHEYGRFSWIDNNRRDIQADPRILFENVFGASPASRSKGVAGAHVLDLAKDDITELKQRLNGSQREKLTTNLDAIEQLANDLEEDIEPGECSHENPGDIPYMDSSHRNETTLAHFNVAANALSCGITRVATIAMGRSADQIVLPETPDLPGISAQNPHDQSHRYGNLIGWANSRRWYAKQAAKFMDTLDSLQDPDVPGDRLLQHTLVVFTSEMADGAPEHSWNMPLVLMGGASGKLQSGSGGRVLDLASQGEQQHHALGRCVNMQRLWATIAQAAGTSVPYEGNVEPLTGIFNT